VGYNAVPFQSLIFFKNFKHIYIMVKLKVPKQYVTAQI